MKKIAYNCTKSESWVASHCESLWVIVSHRESSWVIVSHCESLWVIVSHCESLRGIARHCKALRVIASHCESLWVVVSCRESSWVVVSWAVTYNLMRSCSSLISSASTSILFFSFSSSPFTLSNSCETPRSLSIPPMSPTPVTHPPHPTPLTPPLSPHPKIQLIFSKMFTEKN